MSTGLSAFIIILTFLNIAGATEAVKGHTEQEALIAYLQGLGLASQSWK